MQDDARRVQYAPQLGRSPPRQSLTDVFVPIFGRSRTASAGGFDRLPHRGQNSRARRDVEELLHRRLVHETVD
jgi:hypothetical protein